MPIPFDPGYGAEPFRTLVQNVPDVAVFPTKDFRTEWEPVFHRGRLDGSARLLVIGQDPAQHETIVRRTLVGGAGHGLQGFLAKLGLTRSYVMINTFVYSVFGQGGGNKHRNDPAIIAYRNQWFDALLPQQVKGVVALGQLADLAWQAWRSTPKGAAFSGVYQPVTHPTRPESSSKGDATKKVAIAKMLQGWNTALQALSPAITPDVPTPLVLYGSAFLDSELPDVPQEDLPAGSPAWMCGNADFARRTGADDKLKRVTITVMIPKGISTHIRQHLDWLQPDGDWGRWNNRTLLRLQVGSVKKHDTGGDRRFRRRLYPPRYYRRPENARMKLGSRSRFVHRSSTSASYGATQYQS
jgi:hypothetical protein